MLLSRPELWLKMQCQYVGILYTLSVTRNDCILPTCISTIHGGSKFKKAPLKFRNAPQLATLLENNRSVSLGCFGDMYVFNFGFLKTKMAINHKTI